MKIITASFLLFFTISQMLTAQSSCCTEVEVTASSTSICIGGSTQLNAINTNCGEFPNFTWIPSTGLNNPNIPNPTASPSQSTTYFLRFSSESCPSQIVDFVTITVLNFSTPTFDIEDDYCQGDVAENLPNFSSNGIQGVWFPNSISTTTVGTTSYTFTPLQGECATIFQLQVNVAAMVSPNFSINTNYCIGESPDPLPTTSSNGIGGTWNPSAISTSASGVIQYTFTPNSNECASIFEIDVLVTPEVIPTFSFTTNYCSGDTPDPLPLISDNGVDGSWSPNAITTSTPGTTQYTFIPKPNECASQINIEVDVMQLLTPTFNIITTYCEESIPDELPTISQNGVSGTWNPQFISTTIPGDEIYVFTPSNNDCAEAIEIIITINEMDVPTFNIIDDYCLGDTPDQLPGTSNNGIEGIWNPSTISTAIDGITQYAFTPNSNECATPVEIDILVVPEVIPTFSLNANYCTGDTPDPLPLTSDNGVGGTWNPSAISSSTDGITQYTFTPNSNECASPFIIEVDVIESLTPSFNIITTYCEQSTPDELPSISLDGVSGTWDPQIVSTANPGDALFTFTPSNNDCADAIEIIITITERDIPNFQFNNEYCVGDTPGQLPDVSDNGIAGTWTPSSINTNIAGQSNYVFVPNSSVCATSTTITIEIIQCACAEPPTANAGLNQIICVDDIASLSGLIGGAATSASWSTEGSGSFDDPSNLNASYNPSNADILIGSVSLILTTNDPDGNGPCTASTDEMTITIDNIQADAGPDQTICFGETVQLCANNEPNTTYLWSNSVTTVCTEVSLDESTTFTVDIANENCSATDEVTITVTPEIQIEIIDQNTINISGGTPPYLDTIMINGNVISASVTDANGCTANETIEITTSLQDQQYNSHVNVFPNPANNEIHFQYHDNSQLDFHIRIFSFAGKIVKQLVGRPASISIKGLDPGLYHVQFIQENILTVIPIVIIN